MPIKLSTNQIIRKKPASGAYLGSYEMVMLLLVLDILGIALQHLKRARWQSATAFPLSPSNSLYEGSQSGRQ